jgi:hypothetical protein
MREPKFSDLAVLMRLEIAKVVGGQAVWFLWDWVRDVELKEGCEYTQEMMRLLERFNRIALSLVRQREGRKARNEPYADAVGVRMKMGPRTIGIWPRGPHETQLLTARTASASEHITESHFATWLAGKAQSSRGAGEHSAPPPTRDSSAESKAKRAPQSPVEAANVTDGSNVDRK